MKPARPKHRGLFADLLGSKKPLPHAPERLGSMAPAKPKGAAAPAREPDEPREGARRLRPERSEREPEPLQAFQLPPPVLGSPLQSQGSAQPAGSGLERAQAAALAERLITSMRVGEVSGGHEVRLSFRGVEVRLREVGGVLTPTLRSEDGADLRSLAARVERELEAAGLRFDSVEVED